MTDESGPLNVTSMATGPTMASKIAVSARFTDSSTAPVSGSMATHPAAVPEVSGISNTRPSKWYRPLNVLQGAWPVKVPSLSKRIHAGFLTAAGLLARIDYPTAELNGAGFLPEAILNARAALGPEPLYRWPDVDPPEIPRADVEIDIDMENVLDGVYLWGALVTDRTETGLVNTGYRAFATWDPLTTDTESENFLHFWDWLDTLITSCTRAGASMLAYCWHQAAENTQLRRIARHSPTLKSRVDSFITSGEWVVLERVFKAGWITGGSTGLKAIAPLAGFSWDINNPGGAIAMVRYTEAAAGNTDAQAWLTNYNRGDVEATLAIREMLTRNWNGWPEVPKAGGQ